MKITKQLKAFTLVEMLIVVVIIGILAAALIPRLIGAQASARDTARATQINQAQAGLELYYGDRSVYPPNTLGNGCFDSNVAQELDDYLSDTVSDPQSLRSVTFGSPNPCEGVFAYVAVGNDGQPNAGYVLAANTENDERNANMIVNPSAGGGGGGGTPLYGAATASPQIQMDNITDTSITNNNIQTGCESVTVSATYDEGACTAPNNNAYYGVTANQ